MPKRGLGRGLEALIGGKPPAGEAREIAPSQIRPNPYQPRSSMNDETLNELAESIRIHGVLQPLVVREAANGFELIAGERRLRASMRAGLESVPAIVKACSDAEMLEIALVENLQREDINAIDAAEAYRRLIAEFGLTQEAVAKRVGKSRPAVANTLRLLALSPEIASSVRSGEITEGHARYLLQAPEDRRQEAWRAVRDRDLTVKETSRLVRDLSKAPEERLEKGRQRIQRLLPDPNLSSLADALQTALGTKVRVHRTGLGGRLEIEFYSEDQLEDLIERLLGPADLRA